MPRARAENAIATGSPDRSAYNTPRSAVTRAADLAPTLFKVSVARSWQAARTAHPRGSLDRPAVSRAAVSRAGRSATKEGRALASKARRAAASRAVIGAGLAAGPGSGGSTSKSSTRSRSWAGMLNPAASSVRRRIGSIPWPSPYPAGSLTVTVGRRSAPVPRSGDVDPLDESPSRCGGT
ncbi:hypothetical protein [Spongiactinospora sp. TRM90649]|uniref:hypothetical protein n=1 Tax=Spongiactinospora sp. TRM90649 TaxID=3031114 RepID=UPI0023F6D582|nr:hypothetical protein [Spongiactinospora sp. TRM90649]MDF5756750.1 hypothetical protein [Spongiactinospora sp. TRM90649]